MGSREGFNLGSPSHVFTESFYRNSNLFQISIEYLTVTLRFVLPSMHDSDTML
uniref:Uncharacterized protein n=1 Tax=Rhizophora mucronata TaxID=61149 RepID=A0A2P2QUY7_RHIMU